MFSAIAATARFSWRRAFFVAVLAAVLPMLGSCGSESSTPIAIETYYGPWEAFAPASVLIEGEKEAILVDGQFLLSDGKNIADMIEKSGRKLTAIVLTHAHPDHFFGLKEIVAKYPAAKVLARPGVIDEIKRDFLAKRLQWQDLFPGEVPAEPVIPTELKGDALKLEGHSIEIVDLPPAETEISTAFYIPFIKTLIAGDAVYNRVHPYLADVNDPESWIAALEKLKSVGPIEKVYAGHGDASGPEVFDELAKYLRDYAEVARPLVSQDVIAPRMIELYPEYKLPLMLHLTRGPAVGGSAAFAALAAEENAKAVRALYEGPLSGGSLAELDQLLAPDYVYRDLGKASDTDAAGRKTAVQEWAAIFPDWHYRIEEIIPAGYTFVVRWTGQGTQNAPWLGLPSKGEAIQIAGISVVTAKKGRIQREIVQTDELGAYRQLGGLSRGKSENKKKGK